MRKGACSPAQPAVDMQACMRVYLEAAIRMGMFVTELLVVFYAVALLFAFRTDHTISEENLVFVLMSMSIENNNCYKKLRPFF